jgi:NAD(P)H dehydrogenase (quinone)
MPKSTLKILIIDGHPATSSFCTSLADVYERSARGAGFDVRRINLREMSFDPILHLGYHEIQALEPALVQAQQDILWAEHLVWVFPTWWVGVPALLKGFLDRALLPGFGFKYHKNDPFWDKLLKGRSARVITTMDSPVYYNWFMYRSEGHINFRKGVLEFCGIKPVRTTVFGGMKSSTPEKRTKWLDKVAALGAKGN